jgi:hypothetical protein
MSITKLRERLAVLDNGLIYLNQLGLVGFFHNAEFKRVPFF